MTPQRVPHRYCGNIQMHNPHYHSLFEYRAWCPGSVPKEASVRIPDLPSHNTLLEKVMCTTVNCPETGKVREVYRQKLGETQLHIGGPIICTPCGREVKVMKGWKTGG